MRSTLIGEREKQDWMERYQPLVVYKKQHKNTNVPCKYKADTTLGNWVSTQRSDFRDTAIMDARYQLLKSNGFQWTLRQP